MIGIFLTNMVKIKQLFGLCIGLRKNDIELG